MPTPQGSGSIPQLEKLINSLQEPPSFMSKEISSQLKNVLRALSGNDNCGNLEELLEMLTSLIESLSWKNAEEVELKQHDIDIIYNILKSGVVFNVKEDECMSLRVQRGVVILLRNILVYSPIESAMVIDCLISFWDRINPSSNDLMRYWGTKMSISYIELLSNLLQTQSNLHNVEDFAGPFFELALNSDLWNDRAFVRPFTVFLKNWSSQAVFSNYVLSSGTNLLEMVLQQTRSIDGKAHHEFQENFLHILYPVIAHERFIPFTLNYHETRTPEFFTSLLEACQLVITSDIINISSNGRALWKWCGEMVELVTKETLKALQFVTDEKIIQLINRQAIAVLDIQSCILQECNKDIFDDKAQVVETLGHLLKIMHDKCAVKTLGKAPNDKNCAIVFPNAKSLVVENLGYLCFEDEKVQNQLRESHILESILSSCVIDGYNPFLKEHAVICIKYALQNNSENQDFVAELEARQVVDESVLKHTGCEAVIENGKLALRNRETD